MGFKAWHSRSVVGSLVRWKTYEFTFSLSVI
jgi:hypothetical protein